MHIRRFFNATCWTIKVLEILDKIFNSITFLKGHLSEFLIIIFKGSGFYETDYRSSSYHEAAKKEKDAAAAAPKKSESKDSKTDSKPKGKTKSK